MNKQKIITIFLIFLAAPLTVIGGVFFLDDRKYYFISLLLVIYSLIPFFLHFEERKPQARELMAISVMAALVVAGRAAFFMIPQFKPVVAIVIVSGVALGRGTGFLVGSMGALVSNFFFGMGPYTPWQMFATGIIGYLSGTIFAASGQAKSPAVFDPAESPAASDPAENPAVSDPSPKKTSLCIWGAFSTFFIYGLIMDFSSVLAWAGNLSWKLVGATYLAGLTFNLMHVASTVIFLFFLGLPMIEKLERVKNKYGLNLY